MKFLSEISNLLTLIRSRALDFFCRVFCPKATTPFLGNVAIGLTLASYKVSRIPDVNLTSALPTFKPPLFKPAGANHGAATLSL